MRLRGLFLVWGERGIITYISHYFITLLKTTKIQLVIMVVVSQYFAIFRIKTGDYLGDYMENCIFVTNNLIW